MKVRTTARIALVCLALATAATAQTDHREFDELQRDFQSGEEVTQACLECHEDAAKDVHATIHWTWREPGDETGQIGKAAVTMNNFCININSNWKRCTSCHAGYGWKDATFDFTREDKVDCLVCHEQTGTYKKFPKGAGYPAKEPTKFNGKMFNPPEWGTVAQSVGAPSRNNCGVCHFYGGGGDAVKHGDLDSTLKTPERSLDVHMSPDGAGFTCQECHTTNKHQIAGRQYGLAASMMTAEFTEAGVASQITCESCHEAAPHETAELNAHVDRVACQSCHIPAFARGQATKMWWDWSDAGQKDADGRPKVVKGDDGKPVYHGKKGTFRWQKDVAPEFYWYDGTMAVVTVHDRVDPDAENWLQKPNGSADDGDAKLWPFKVHRGMTPYDAGRRTMAVPKLIGKPGTGAYWADWDWDAAIAKGMKSVGVEYSGEYGFVKTAYAYPVTHMVAPKENTTACTACHVGDDGGDLKVGLGEF